MNKRYDYLIIVGILLFVAYLLFCSMLQGCSGESHILQWADPFELVKETSTRTIPETPENQDLEILLMYSEMLWHLRMLHDFERQSVDRLIQTDILFHQC